MKHRIEASYTIVKSILTAIGTHWFSAVIVTYICLFFLQVNFIFPIEKAYFDESTTYASLLFLPHAVRVIAAWLLGPKAILALFPATVISAHLYEPLTLQAPALYIYCLASSASAVIAFEFLKLMKMNVYPSGKMKSWRNILFAGFLASFISTFGGIYFIDARLDFGKVVELSFRYITGDTLGLIVSMFVLMILFRYGRYFENR
ncbi:hypothetical protein [Candidatus Puniceispirillum sp.]|uniref:hypothetical protein n=1 Tax=Candidatus Puniceispirillum sp. TaxID=2026719 RepID=UPI003F6967CC